MEKEIWLSMNEICAHLCISRDTELKWINKKNMPAHKIEKIWRFSISEVDEWVKNNGKIENSQES